MLTLLPTHTPYAHGHGHGHADSTSSNGYDQALAQLQMHSQLITNSSTNINNNGAKGGLSLRSGHVVCVGTNVAVFVVAVQVSELTLQLI